MKNMVQSVKGTRDFYPEEMAVRNWLYATVKKVSNLFGYEEWEAPILERLDLYAAKSGEELVNDQAYVFEDRGGDKIALRPELTPSLARLVAQKQKQLVYPLRWWSFGPFWRYERPQKGRTREFFQWNIDMIGPDTPEADAELIAVCAQFFREVNFSSDQVKIQVNNRKLMENLLLEIGIQKEDWNKTFKVIDRQDKLRPEAWKDFAMEMGLTPDQFDQLKSALENKDLWKESDEMVRLFDTLKSLGVHEYIQYNPRIIRGLDYYTRTVFEAVHLDGGRSILGGGRYDNLVQDVGGDPLSAVGFAMGDLMITTLLREYDMIPNLNKDAAQIMVAVFDEETLQNGYQLAAEIRAMGARALCYPEPAKLNKQFKFADRKDMRYVLLLGPDEIKNRQVVIKDMKEKTQVSISRDELSQFVEQFLAQHNLL